MASTQCLSTVFVYNIHCACGAYRKGRARPVFFMIVKAEANDKRSFELKKNSPEEKKDVHRFLRLRVYSRNAEKRIFFLPSFNLLDTM